MKLRTLPSKSTSSSNGLWSMMVHFSDNREFDLYRDINTRTNEAGKRDEPFIKRFMDLMVLPFMEAAGKPLYDDRGWENDQKQTEIYPQEAAEIPLPGSSAGILRRKKSRGLQ